MLPNSVVHHGISYNLKHLNPHERNFTWRCQNGTDVTFQVLIRYSSHCISKEIQGPTPNGTHCFLDHKDVRRVFDLDRYQWSLDLPDVVGDLLLKPTTTIKLTAGHNWYHFRLHMKHPLPSGEKYYCFMNLRSCKTVRKNPALHRVSIFVESAYSRNTPPHTPHHQKSMMFGRLAEELATRKIKGRPKPP